MPRQPARLARPGRPAPGSQALQRAQARRRAAPSASAPAVLAELQAELAGAELAAGMTATTKELHGAVSKLGKASWQSTAGRTC